MSTRELLELAANAAGIGGAWDHFREEFRLYVRGQRLFLGATWAPHTDDGDSRRLQVACKIEAGCDEVRAWAERWDGIVRFTNSELHHGDPLGTMRRVVLLSAADMGRRRRMP